MVRIKRSKLIALLFFTISLSSNAHNYSFKGNHFICQYKQCNAQKLNDPIKLVAAMLTAIQEGNASYLSHLSYSFAPQGFTAVFLLSESHASIHTYPEHNSCFVDFFTCGTTTEWLPFHLSLQRFLESNECEYDFLHRE